jgi:acyl transferase domain-containing protein
MYGIDIAMYALLESLGLQPVVLIGHSFGELAALVCAGAFSIAEGAFMVCQRVHVLQRHQGCHGSMLALKTPVSRAQMLVELLSNQHTVIAAENSERQTVIAGPKDAIERMAHLASMLRIPLTVLDSPYPFHSPLLQPMANDLSACIGHLSQKTLKYPVFSPILRRYYRDDDLLTHCLAQHLTQKVHFQEAIVSIWSQNVKIFVECGALSALRNLTKKIVKTDDILAISCLDPEQGELHSLDLAIHTLAQQGLLAPKCLVG